MVCSYSITVILCTRWIAVCVQLALAYNPAGPRDRGIMMELFAATRPCSYAWSSSAFGATAPTEKRKQTLLALLLIFLFRAVYDKFPFFFSFFLFLTALRWCDPPSRGKHQDAATAAAAQKKGRRIYYFRIVNRCLLRQQETLRRLMRRRTKKNSGGRSSNKHVVLYTRARL